MSIVTTSFGFESSFLTHRYIHGNMYINMGYYFVIVTYILNLLAIIFFAFMSMCSILSKSKQTCILKNLIQVGPA